MTRLFFTGGDGKKIRAGDRVVLDSDLFTSTNFSNLSPAKILSIEPMPQDKISVRVCYADGSESTWGLNYVTKHWVLVPDQMTPWFKAFLP